MPKIGGRVARLVATVAHVRLCQFSYCRTSAQWSLSVLIGTIRLCYKPRTQCIIKPLLRLNLANLAAVKYRY